MCNSQRSCTPFQRPLICLESPLNGFWHSTALWLMSLPLYLLWVQIIFLPTFSLVEEQTALFSLLIVLWVILWHGFICLHKSRRILRRLEYKKRQFSPQGSFPFNAPWRTFNCFLNDPQGLPRMSLLSSLWRRPSPFHSNSLWLNYRIHIINWRQSVILNQTG